MIYRILKETSPGVFENTGETFDGGLESVAAHLIALQAEHGACFAAEQIERA